MKNFIINNNEAILDNNNPKNKKTKTETQIELLTTQAQQISEQLETYQVKQKKVNNLMNALWFSERFGNKFLNELVESEKSLQKQDNWRLEKLIKNEVAFAFKFEAGVESFYQLVFREIYGEVDSLSNDLRNIKDQLQHQQRIFARLDVVRINCFYHVNIAKVSAI